MKLTIFTAVFAALAFASCSSNNNEKTCGTHTHSDGTVHEGECTEAAAPVQENIKIDEVDTVCHNHSAKDCSKCPNAEHCDGECQK